MINVLAPGKQVAVITLLASVLALSVFAQDSAVWKNTKENDPLHGKIHDKFVLGGKFLTPPRSAPQGFVPSITVSCFDGKVEQNYVSVGAVVNRKTDSSLGSKLYPVDMEARIDGKKENIEGTGVSTDGQSVFFARLDLKKVLKAHQVILGVNEYLGPEVVVQFDLPDPAPIFTSCDKDRILKAK